MRCRDIERFVTAYVDGDLDDARASAVRGHVRCCADCAAVVESEALVRNAAEELDPAIDPPPSLWEGIEARIAQAEVADSERSRTWLWWQGVRRQFAFAAAAAAIAAIAVVWLSSGSEPQPVATVQPSPAVVEPTLSVEQQLSDELVRADERYQKTIRELLEIAAQEREEWTPAMASAFDQRLVELEGTVSRERASASGDRSPASHDGLFAAYQTQISFLHGEVLR